MESGILFWLVGVVWVVVWVIATLLVMHRLRGKCAFWRRESTDYLDNWRDARKEIEALKQDIEIARADRRRANAHAATCEERIKELEGRLDPLALVTLDEATEILGYKRRTSVSTLVTRGRLKVIAHVDKMPCFARSEVKALAAELAKVRASSGRGPGGRFASVAPKGVEA